MKKYLPIFLLVGIAFFLFVFNSIVLARNDNTSITICHKAGDEWHTITVDDNALQAHLDHGDYLGPCTSSSSSQISSSNNKESESSEKSESSFSTSSASVSITVLGAGTGDLAEGE